MQTLVIICFVIALLLLVLVAGIVPRRSRLSRFELHRRKDTGSAAANDELDRELVLDDVLSLQKVLASLLLVVTVLCAVGAFGWLFGTITAVLVALGYGRLAQFEAIRALADRLYRPYDDSVVQFVKKHPRLGRIIRNISVDVNDPMLSSREELLHLVESSGHILTSDEKKLIENGLHFADKTVESIMTPRGVVATIAAGEVLGPLVLDDLHKTGYSRFPVIDGDIDHVIGMLHARELLTLGNKSSQTAREAMEKRVYYIREDQTLDHALAAFLKTRHHLFVVVNGYRETAGIVTLEDVIEALLGRKIVDEFDLHDDLRAVAAHEAKGNNDTPNGIVV